MEPVSFMVIGAQKSGTTSLAYQLAQHPQICFSSRKEPHYFSRNENWQADLASYHALFAPEVGQICGEGSTSYTLRPQFPHTARHLYAYNPSLKLIYMVRHPVDRIESHYHHRLIQGKVSGEIEQEILAEPLYVDRSRYAFQLEPYLEYFPRNQLLLLLFEEFVAAPEATLSQIATFLGIAAEGFEGIDDQRRNVSAQRRAPRKNWFALLRAPLQSALTQRVPQKLKTFGGKLLYRPAPQRIRLPAKLQAQLWQLLEPDVIEFEQLLGRRIEIWRR
ncbi:MAG: sulfotransferase [Anaerolineales bacterium]|nr:sulfotransferase [Anaerolineales bacterium]MCB0027275.1 sulfotransferase [Anaerolineales bacterium]